MVYNMESLSVVIPTYNEVLRLPSTLDEILPFLRENYPSHEIIVVDDNSPDGTAQYVEERARIDTSIKLIVQPYRIGKGAAIRRGCMAAAGDCILFMDADHSTPIREVSQMVSILRDNRADAVVGVRTYQEDESRWRRIVGLVLQLMAHIIVFRRAVVDSQCGFKLFSQGVKTRIFPYCRTNGGMIDVEIFHLMHKYDIRCFYQPVHWKNKTGSKVRVSKSAFVDTLELFRIRVRDGFDRYSRELSDEKQPWKQKKTNVTNAKLNME